MKTKKVNVIVRGDRSGVFCGTMVKRNGREVTLHNARKLFYWDGACAVEQISTDGTVTPENCKFTVIVDEIVLTDAIQIIPCTKKAYDVIMGVKEWKR